MNRNIRTTVLYSSSNIRGITTRNTTVSKKGFITEQSRKSIMNLAKFINRK